MSQSVSLVQYSCIDNFPAKVPQKAFGGFLVTAMINLLVGSAINVAIVGGAIAATATVVEAISRSIIKTVFPEWGVISIVPSLIISATWCNWLAGAIVPWCGVSYKSPITRFQGFVAFFFLNFGFYRRNEAIAEVL